MMIEQAVHLARSSGQRVIMIQGQPYLASEDEVRRFADIGVPLERVHDFGSYVEIETVPKPKRARASPLRPLLLAGVVLLLILLGWGLLMLAMLALIGGIGKRTCHLSTIGRQIRRR